MYVCMHVCRYVCIHMHMRACVCVCECVCAIACICACIPTATTLNGTPMPLSTQACGWQHGPHRTLVQLCSHVLRFELIYLPARPRVKHAGVIIHRPICLLFGASCRPLSLSLCLSLSLSLSLALSLSLYLSLSRSLSLSISLSRARSVFSLRVSSRHGGALAETGPLLDGSRCRSGAGGGTAPGAFPCPHGGLGGFRSNVAIRHAGSSVWAHCAQGKASG